ncbi:Peptidoglycan-binding (PGRP) domain of peptidoglycan hydrolases-containing protein [Alkalithermobacter thermoalcaliphilus JW-YL-7 = DSM 7308]|uniref:Peptidoglycan-binding (PGRP) domain of peptidoglycan hydrolases-containing protein n=1 Tax=Alkalithermobacter thermoalcaliphilus JW-YL-7 = DSM 7308 TaxID=1121328 RepID=A0A150FRQ5_CLOPD|nr:Peptidoglycan-binding domain 1 protein [[Clostridium] paradoxum JW-YL-7 = DSM 7308]SHK38927.1 Peptidoglycan-binding (PGRP) domain of peptidoglycan hydrolases-containing protein [[Clostridium] paradoxum JW-YL-7 = DSM 7308]
MNKHMRKKIIATVIGVGIFVSPFNIQSINANTIIPNTVIMRVGNRSNEVSLLQTRLKELGYFNHNVTGYFGTITKAAVQNFQRDNRIAADGIVGPQTINLLNNNRTPGVSLAPVSRSTTISRVIRMGMSGEEVSNLQRRLKELGYFNHNITGYFGTITKAAVQNFQRDSGIAADGIVGPQTINALNSPQTLVSRGSVVDRSTAQMTWFDRITHIIPRGTTFTVTDVYTGRQFNVRRTYGTNHADCETVTQQDTQIMLSVYGGTWSWNRRPIIVEVNGMRIPASMAGMPHGSQFIHDNGMNGHFDIHFLGSRTHGTNRVDPWHQDTIKIAERHLNR